MYITDMGLLTNAGPPPWHPATAPLRVGEPKMHLLGWILKWVWVNEWRGWCQRCRKQKCSTTACLLPLTVYRSFAARQAAFPINLYICVFSLYSQIFAPTDWFAPIDFLHKYLLALNDLLPQIFAFTGVVQQSRQALPWERGGAGQAECLA